MKKTIFVKEYTRKRHGRAKFGGKVSAHTKSGRASGYEHDPNDLNYYDTEEVFKEFWRGNILRDYKGFDFNEAFRVARDRFKSKLAQHGFFGGEGYLENLEETYGSPIPIDYLATSTDYITITEDEIKNAILENGDYKGLISEYIYNDVNDLDENELKELLKEYGVDDKDSLIELETKEIIDDPYALAEYVFIGDELSGEELRLAADYVAGRYYEQFKDYPSFQELKRTYDELQYPPDDIRGKAILMDRVINAVHETGSLWDDVDVPELRKEFEREWAVRSGRATSRRMRAEKAILFLRAHK